MPYYAVIDTNVIVSALLIPESIPAFIISLVKTNLVIPLVNDEIIAEYSLVLHRPKFNFTNKKIEEMLDIIFDKSIFVMKTQSYPNLIDEDDAVFIELTMSTRSTFNTYLITGNIKHFPKVDYILTPRQFLDLIGDER